MVVHEPDLQSYLTEAIPGYLQILGDFGTGFHPFCRRTPPSGEQPTELPRGLGLDVLSIVDAKRILALELKKTDHETRTLGDFQPGQKAFLKYVDKLPFCNAYLVFDRMPSLNMYDVRGLRAQQVARLNRMAAVPPQLVDAVEASPASYIGPGAIGSTMLDVVTRIVFDLQQGTADAYALMDYLGEHVDEINNCFFWFFGEDYALGLTLDELKRSFAHLAEQSSPGASAGCCKKA
ncbi:hypothetical protein GTP81_08530 [Rugamonas sp. FT107W]|uniref:Uncharacterized protein n=1 Tax=Duganella vulcania TaxID=2692166 RepID=A0A845HJK6_9BURK|nr:hypothetical protein [Duganella vulcania]MYN16796.1 hypothetical protein [Duganella vulcania]